MRTVCIADTHDIHDGMEIPDGELLIHAGDLTMGGTEAQVRAAARFLAALPHPHKVVIAGNHDYLFEREPARAAALMEDVTYLRDSETVVEGLRIYGSPWQPWFHDWAFNLQRGAEIRAKWDLIPNGVDILVTHGPPLGKGDRVARGENVGCEDLLDAVHRVKPRYHIFGHIHEGYGVIHGAGTVFVNASLCDRRYTPGNKPIVLEV